ncbi:unnamed protein product [Owenia fusiformis]|uniref:FYVE-type domain-containing protein n=1 Tax=Owenia fusiformis TaxID=6347 RepID=A0A8S4N5Q5_OWEFU|nr:unnamed protein product [Owenia fusiformis]
MDGFVFDLDKVLDDFEMNEDTVPVPGSGDKKFSQDYINSVKDTINPYAAIVPSASMPLGGGVPIEQNDLSTPTNTQPFTSLMYDSPYDSPDRIDMSEADFGPSPIAPNVMPLTGPSADSNEPHIRHMTDISCIPHLASADSATIPPHQPDVVSSTMNSANVKTNNLSLMDNVKPTHNAADMNIIEPQQHSLERLHSIENNTCPAQVTTPHANISYAPAIPSESSQSTATSMASTAQIDPGSTHEDIKTNLHHKDTNPDVNESTALDTKQECTALSQESSDTIGMENTQKPVIPLNQQNDKESIQSPVIQEMDNSLPPFTQETQRSPGPIRESLADEISKAIGTSAHNQVQLATNELNNAAVMDNNTVSIQSYTTNSEAIPALDQSEDSTKPLNEALSDSLESELRHLEVTGFKSEDIVVTESELDALLEESNNDIQSQSKTDISVSLNQSESEFLNVTLGQGESRPSLPVIGSNASAPLSSLSGEVAPGLLTNDILNSVSSGASNNIPNVTTTTPILGDIKNAHTANSPQVIEHSSVNCSNESVSSAPWSANRLGQDIGSMAVSRGSSAQHGGSSESAVTSPVSVPSPSLGVTSVSTQPQASPQLGIGARPKEPVNKHQRPNSLLGLSTVPLDNMNTEAIANIANQDNRTNDETTATTLHNVSDSYPSQVSQSMPPPIGQDPPPYAKVNPNPQNKSNMNPVQQNIVQPIPQLPISQDIPVSHGMQIETPVQPADLPGQAPSPNNPVEPVALSSTPEVQSTGLISADATEQHSATVEPRIEGMDTSSAAAIQGLSAVTSAMSLVDPNILTVSTGATHTLTEEEQMAIAQLSPESQAKRKRPTSLSLPPREFSAPPEKKASPSQESESSIEDPGSVGPPPAQNIAEPLTDFLDGAGLESVGLDPTAIRLGKVAPFWIPDNEATKCMNCDSKFTFTKRRHHCRACGKVLCSLCCKDKTKLIYMDNKEARVCQMCHTTINKVQAFERLNANRPRPDPNKPSEYCSTIPPIEQAQATGHLNAPPPTVMVPAPAVDDAHHGVSGVLKREGSQKKSEPKQVMFSDGIRPGGDLAELDGSSAIPTRRPMRAQKKVELPSIVSADLSIEDRPDIDQVMKIILDEENPEPAMFAINKNLFVLVKLLNLSCCVKRTCWCFTTRGLCTVGQEELVVVLESQPNETKLPKDIFAYINTMYENASKGNTVSFLDNTLFTEPFLDSRDHAGFIYIRPTFQCLNKLILPQQPYLFALLIQKWETPWAKVFPLRLMLRLGAEYRYYPCPLISVRHRKPVFGEIGHTIMNLLADFRNFQYMLPKVKGVTIHMENKRTFINFPRNRYDEIMKIVSNSNDHVMALAGNFSLDADSHLVCLQTDEGNYQTQAINIQNKPRKVTGASFVVFNGALKSASGLTAKSSIVEDGLMVQISSDLMIAMKHNLREMQDYTIGCGAIGAQEPEEIVMLQWVEDDKQVNIGVKSSVDNMSLDGVESLHIHNSTDYVGDGKTIRWTEVFFLKNEESGGHRGEPVDLSRLAETLASATCLALAPYLSKLKEAGMTKLALRATIDNDNVGYEAGSNGEKMQTTYMNALDNELIPVIHNAGSQSQDGPVSLELVFYVLD